MSAATEVGGVSTCTPPRREAARGQRHRVIQEENRGPPPGPGEREPPIPELCDTGDPQLPSMVTHHLFEVNSVWPMLEAASSYTGVGYGHDEAPTSRCGCWPTTAGR